jgi:hypothetical protein
MHTSAQIRAPSHFDVRTPAATDVTQSGDVCRKEKYLALVRMAVHLLNGKTRNAAGKSTNKVLYDNTDNWGKQQRTTVSQHNPIKAERLFSTFITIVASPTHMSAFKISTVTSTCISTKYSAQAECENRPTSDL